MRKSIREFAALLGVETTTVNNWRSGLSAVKPRSTAQAILDTTYLQRASPADRERFEQIVADGETAWRERHSPLLRHTQTGVARTDRDHDGELAESGDPTITTDLLAVLARVHKLSRSVNPEIIDQLRISTHHAIANYETVDPAGLVPALKQQRVWLDDLIDECSHPKQRSELFDIASETSGLLGYIAVGTGDYSMARAYCLESFHLGDNAQNANLTAWARGLQSFCEYYAGRYERALDYARDGLDRAQDGPQSVRLAINGVARAMGKLGDTDGVRRTVDRAYELVTCDNAPEGVPSSISLGSYSAAQVAGNAATSYLSLAMPSKVEQYAGLALADMNNTNSPWGRSLVMIDVARSQVLAEDADLDAAVAIMHDALDTSPGKPMAQVQRRASEFLRDVAERWGDTSQLKGVRDALASKDGK
ncbi:hypothetical protein ACGFQG_19085 [Nocardia fluminea]|uniref:hypothetical protein n=1 Tax=Nocardia fluminea TaxID=134984 RepID=UPI003719F1C0